MDDDLRDLVEENNKMLKKLYRKEKTKTIFFWIRWGIIIALVIFGYQIAKPFIDSLMGGVESVQTSIQEISEIKDKIKNVF